MKTFELCYLGNLGKGHRFRVTSCTENGVKLDARFNDLYFKKPILKGLWIGAYCLTDTEDDNTFGNWRHQPKPSTPLVDEDILQYSIESRAKTSAANALKYAKKDTRDVDALIKEMRDNMFMLDRGERAAFAMYIYQQLTK